MRQTCFFLVFLSLQNVLPAQGFMKGDIVVSATTGVPHLHKEIMRLNTKTDAFKNSFHGNPKVISIKGINPLTFKYEYSISQHFGLGICIGAWSINLKVEDSYDYQKPGFTNLSHTTDTYKYRFSSVSFGIRPNVHFPLQDKKSDLFIGCGFGLTKNTISINFTSTSSTISGYYDGGAKAVLYFAPTLGYRRFLTANVGLNLEAGYEKGALLQAGLMFRFRPLKYEPVK